MFITMLIPVLILYLSVRFEGDSTSGSQPQPQPNELSSLYSFVSDIHAYIQTYMLRDEICEQDLNLVLLKGPMLFHTKAYIQVQFWVWIHFIHHRIDRKYIYIVSGYSRGLWQIDTCFTWDRGSTICLLAFESISCVKWNSHTLTLTFFVLFYCIKLIIKANGILS